MPKSNEIVEVVYIKVGDDGSFSVAEKEGADIAKLIYGDGRVEFGEPVTEGEAELHYGPGAHPSGSPQKVHGERPSNAMEEKHRLGHALAKKANEIYQGVEIVYSSERKQFKRAGREMWAAASYNPATNTITLRPNTIDRYGRLKDATLFHELQHARWKRFQDQYYAEYKDILDIAENSDSPDDWPITALVEVKPGYEGRWPAYELYRKTLYSDEQIAYWGTLNRVSDYSASYWDSAKNTNDRIRAIDETLADIAEMEQTGRTTGIPDEWMQFYKDIKNVTESP